MMTETFHQRHSALEGDEVVVVEDFLPAVLGATVSEGPTGEAIVAEASGARVLVPWETETEVSLPFKGRFIFLQAAVFCMHS